MTISSTADLVLELNKYKLLTPGQLQELTGHLSTGFKGPKALALALVQRGWLTKFQVDLLIQSRAHQLNQGQFLLVDRIGEGGMGQVFKAHHQRLQRTVALKVLRQELVDDAEAVARFYREIQVASQLPPHPNLVQVYDAGPIGTTHFLAMEYVQGSDLQRLVKEMGPLPVAQACDILRQAALGLQHAHQHGLVHRDIKPANLMMSGGMISVKEDTPISIHRSPATSGSVVKVLDLGLARLQATAQGSRRENSLLTADGPITMGTVDYQAPEQAIDFHRADIRADIYSLGCTAYYLLTGKPPFGSGSLAIKLMRHQQAEPPPVDQFRDDIPAGLAGVLGKMLAKRPEDRYQTPAEVAAALAPLLNIAGESLPGADPTLPATAEPTEVLPVANWPSRTGSRSQRAGQQRRLLFAASGAVLLIGVVGLAFLWRGKGGTPSAVSASTKKEARVAGYPATILADGAVGYWRLNETAGTTAVDSTASPANGSYTGGVTLGQSGAITNPTDSAVNFDGLSAYVQVGNVAKLNMTTSTTLEAWIYPTGVGSGESEGGIIINKHGEYEVARFGDGSIQWAFANRNPGWEWHNTGYVAPLNQWTYLAVVYHNGVVSTYANGALVHTYNGSGAIGKIAQATNDFRIGGREGLEKKYSQYFQGRLDEVAVYATPLTAAQIQNHYKIATAR
jgi:serine/threonine protein kinase